MKQTVCVLGDGAWGTAVATVLAHNGYHVRLWCNDPEAAATIKTHAENKRYLPGVILDPAIEPTTDLGHALHGVQWVFEAIPVKYLRAILQAAAPYTTKDQTWVVLSKGIEQNTLMFPSAIIDDVLGYHVPKAIFSGPSFAHDLAHNYITAASVAATDCEVGNAVQQLLATSYCRPYVALDVIGVQVGGALKNVITLAIGMLDGAGYTDNTKAFIVTRGLDEMARVAIALGGKRETLYGLSGMGDLVLTAMGKLSRNLAVGKRLGAGYTVAQLCNELGHMPEGVNTVVSVNQLAHKLNISLPICQGIYRVMFEELSLEQMLLGLMDRPLEHECDFK